MNPSILITPNAKKAGKLYSIIPTDGSGDLSVVRATTATRFNSDGLIESVGVNIPRLDYSNGCPSILVEPQRTNLFSYSEQFDNAYWSKSGTKIIADDTISPDGNTTADALLGSGANSSHYLSKSISFTLGTTYTISIFAKKGTNNFIQLGGQNSVFGLQAYANFDLENGVLGTVAAGTSASIIGFSDNWYKCSITINSLATNSGSIFFSLINSSTSVKLEPNTLDKTVYIWGAQLEAGSNATSYIPTVASSVTRNADVISKTGISDLIGQTEGTIFVEFDNTKVDIVNRYIFSMYDSASIFDKNIEFFISTANQLLLNSRSLGTTQVSYNNGNVSLQKYKIVYKYEENNTKIFINGSLVFIDNLCSIPEMNSINLGMRSNLISNLNDGINLVAIYKTLLTDQQCIDLTTI